MTNEKAVKVLRVHKLYINPCNDNLREAMDMAIDALENKSTNIHFDKIPEPTMRRVVEGIFPIIKRG